MFAQKLAEAQYRSATFFAKKITTSRSVSHFCKNIELSQFWNNLLHWRLKNIELPTFLIRNVRKPNEICQCNLKNIETSHFFTMKIDFPIEFAFFFFCECIERSQLWQCMMQCHFHTTNFMMHAKNRTPGSRY